MSRNTSLDALFGARATPKPADITAEFAAANSPPHTQKRRRSGAIGAMSSTLRGLAAQADAAAAIEQGSQIVEIDPSLIDASFVADRIADANDPP